MALHAGHLVSCAPHRYHALDETQQELAKPHPLVRPVVPVLAGDPLIGLGQVATGGSELSDHRFAGTLTLSGASTLVTVCGSGASWLVWPRFRGRDLTYTFAWVADRRCLPAFPTVVGGPDMIERTSVGLDVHARSVAAAAIDSRTGEFFKSTLVPDHAVVLDWVLGLPGPVAVVYEAGPTGFGLCRYLRRAGIPCEVVAPSRLQKPAGDRVNTDAKDAVHLARLLRLDEVVAVAVPSVEQEAARDLVRAREDSRGDLMSARQRLSKLLLRHGIVYYGGKAWTGKHDLWLRQETLGQLSSPATRLAFDEAYETVLATTARRDRLEAAIEEMAADSQFTPVVRRLGCLRGIGTLTGFTLAVEIGDWHRFTGNTIGSFAGLVPSEYSSGSSRTLGRSPRPATATPAGFWSRRLGTTGPSTGSGTRCVPARTLHPTAARARGDQGNRRSHQRWVKFIDRRKRSTVADVAIARELAGWCWSLATLDDS